MGVTAVIPLKALASAKGRLSGVLDEPERRRVVAAMAAGVIDACTACPLIDDVVVVAGDDEAAAVAHRSGADAIVVTQPGLAAAFDVVDRELGTRDAMLVVMADLPSVSADDLAAVIAAAEGAAPVVVVAPANDGGTGALLRRPPTVIATAYGPDSAREHERAAAAAGVAVVVLHRDGLALDVDTPAQLAAALAQPGGDDVPCAPR